MDALIAALDAYAQAHGCTYGVECNYEQGKWWSIEVRLSPLPSRPNQADMSLVLFRWSELSLHEMAHALIDDVHSMDATWQKLQRYDPL